MKKILLFVLMCFTFTIGFSATKIKTEKTKVKKEKAEKQQKIVYNIYSGEYNRVTNTFTYKKDNLILPDRKKSYPIYDVNNSLDRVYKFLNEDYEVKDNQTIGLKIIGRIENGTMILWQVENYRIPEENLKGRENYILFGQ